MKLRILGADIAPSSFGLYNLHDHTMKLIVEILTQKLLVNGICALQQILPIDQTYIIFIYNIYDKI